MPMDDKIRRKVRDNLFPAARAAVEPWDKFPWHTGRDGQCDSWVGFSSQALAIDVFGTIMGSTRRDAIMDAVAAELGLPGGGDWDIHLEWPAPKSALGEPRVTQVDVMARNGSSVMLLECKFTEAQGGACSQPNPLPSGPNKGLRQCNGNYEPQSNPVNGKTARCALTAKKIRYWEYIPEVLGISATDYHLPCPFHASSLYQWMRNLVLAWRIAVENDLKAGFAVVYADAEGLPMAAEVRSKAWEQFASHVDPRKVAVGAISFQSVVEIAAGAADESAQERWHELRSWVGAKITAVADGAKE